MQIDAHDLGAGFIKEAGVEIPDEIRGGDFPSAEEATSYGDDDFGVVIFDGENKLRKFACPTPEAAWLNAQFLKLSWDHMPKTAAVLAGSNLLTRMAEGNIFDDELWDKVASSLYTDYRMEGELSNPYGIQVVDITNCPMEKKAFWQATGRGFQMLGRAATGTWGAGSAAAATAAKGTAAVGEAAAKPGAGILGRGVARVKGMAQGAKAYGGAIASDLKGSGKAVLDARSGAIPGQQLGLPGMGAQAVSPSVAQQGWRGALGQASGTTRDLAAAGTVAAGGTAVAGGIGYAGYRKGRGAKPPPQYPQAKYASGIRNALAASGVTALVAAPTAAYFGNKAGKKEGRRIGASAVGSKAYHEGERDGYARAVAKLQATKTAEAPMAKTAALGDQYDISTPDTIKQAERYFDEHWKNFHPRDRRDYAVNTVKQAEAQGVKLQSARLVKYAGSEISTQVLTHLTYRGRQDCVDDAGRDVLMKLAESIPNLDADGLANSLTEFDEHYGISRQWDSRIPDPYAAVCAEKTAEERYTWTDGVDKVTDEELQHAASTDLSSIANAIGEGPAREFQKNPVTVFKSLPDPIKGVVARVASARRSTLGNNDLY